MAAKTPVKLITDYFTKSPPRDDGDANTDNTHTTTLESNFQTKTNSSLPSNKIPIVLPPTPENSPCKDTTNDKNKSHTKKSPLVNGTKHAETSLKDLPTPSKDGDKLDNSSSQPKRTVARSLALDKSKRDSAKGDVTPTDTDKSTESASVTKKSRRRRRRNKKSALNQSTDLSSSSAKTSTPQNKLVTDYFPVRRSGRRCESKIKEDKEKHLRDLIEANCEHGLEVVTIEGKGRGVVATKVFDIADFVVEYAGELVFLSTAKKREDYYSRDADIGCYMYYFEHKSKRYCVDATKETGRLGRLLNHSKIRSNYQTKVVEVNGTPRLILVAIKPHSVPFS